MIKLKRLKKSFVYASRGLLKVFREEQNFQIHFLIAGLVLFLAWFFSLSLGYWLILLLLIGLVWLMEIINSAIERLSDALKPRLDNYVKDIKDIMSAAVFLACLLAVIIGCLIFVPYFLDFFRNLL